MKEKYIIGFIIILLIIFIIPNLLKNKTTYFKCREEYIEYNKTNYTEFSNVSNNINMQCNFTEQNYSDNIKITSSLGLIKFCTEINHNLSKR